MIGKFSLIHKSLMMGQQSRRLFGAKFDSIIKGHLKTDVVTVFSLKTCPYCIKAKNLLESNEIPYESITVDGRSDEFDYREALIEGTNHRTFPNIFLGEKHIGGFSELNALNQEGELEEWLEGNK